MPLSVQNLAVKGVFEPTVISKSRVVATHDAKDGVKSATPIGITLQRFILYTLASFGSYYSPTFLIYAYVRT